MLVRLRAWPLIVILMGIAGLLMYVPAAHAAAVRDWADARAFLYSGTLVLALTAMIGIATASVRPANEARSHLLALVTAFTALPAVLALPFYEAVGNTRFLNAYFEMVSSLTTTGATLFPDPGRLSGAEHLWRALVGWAGGFLVWTAAVAILAPLNLGGFEVLSQGAVGRGATGTSQITRVADGATRLRRYAAGLAPIYGGLTLALAVLLLILGETPLVAVCHAMATLSTSGISPVGGDLSGRAGLGAEMLVLVFLVFAISRQTFTRDGVDDGRTRLFNDPEMRMGALCVLVVPAFLFLRHWVGAYEVAEQGDLAAGLQALWGAIFTVLSFLTTTGFESAAWDASRAWSGLETPGLMLMGLALVGGGVATTAGGVKLLRVYALYKHGAREVDLLIHPNSVGGAGAQGRRLRRQGAYLAWIFFMLFAMSIAAIMLALSLTGLDFEEAVILTIAALSTTGPLAAVAGAAPLDYADLSDAAKAVLAASMVLGRMEALAIIALLNPDFWRN